MCRLFLLQSTSIVRVIVLESVMTLFKGVVEKVRAEAQTRGVPCISGSVVGGIA